MAQADPQSLQIHPDAADPALAQQQTQFNTLVRDIALWRAALAEWNDRIARWQQAVEPVRRELQAAWRQWVFALDHASLQPGLSRAEHRLLGELLREAVAPLLELEDDAEMAAVAADNPFPKMAPNRTVAIFLDKAPPADALSGIRGQKNEELRLGRREIYVHYGEGIGTSKLVIPATKTGTARNMNTIATLAKMAAEL